MSFRVPCVWFGPWICSLLKVIFGVSQSHFKLFWFRAFRNFCESLERWGNQGQGISVPKENIFLEMSLQTNNALRRENWDIFFFEHLCSIGTWLLLWVVKFWTHILLESLGQEARVWVARFSCNWFYISTLQELLVILTELFRSQFISILLFLYNLSGEERPLSLHIQFQHWSPGPISAKIPLSRVGVWKSEK